MYALAELVAASSIVHSAGIFLALGKESPALLIATLAFAFARTHPEAGESSFDIACDMRSLPS